jgi:hypothetical protein
MKREQWTSSEQIHKAIFDIRKKAAVDAAWAQARDLQLKHYWKNLTAKGAPSTDQAEQYGYDRKMLEKMWRSIAGADKKVDALKKKLAELETLTMGFIPNPDDRSIPR